MAILVGTSNEAFPSGFHLVPNPIQEGVNLFSGTLKTDAEAARDAYFASNPDQLARYDNDSFLLIQVKWTSPSLAFEFQLRSSGTWINAFNQTVSATELGTHSVTELLDVSDAGSGQIITVAERDKLAGIAAQATKNQTDAYLLNRANHTGGQAIATVSGLQTALDGKTNIGHTQPISSIIDLQDELDLKSGTGHQHSMAVSGDATGSVTVGSTSVNMNLTVLKSNLANKLNTPRLISTSGDATGSVSFDGSADVTIPLTLANSGVVAGVYPKVSVDVKGRVLSGTTLSASDIPVLDWSKIGTGKPTTLAGYGITDALPINGTAVAAAKWSTSRTITLSGQAAGSVSLDGSSNVTLNVSGLDGSHTHTIANVTGLQSALDSKQNKIEGISIRRYIQVSNGANSTTTVSGGATTTILPLLATGSNNSNYNNPNGYGSLNTVGNYIDIRNLHIGADISCRITYANNAGGNITATPVLRLIPDINVPSTFIDVVGEATTFSTQSAVSLSAYTGGFDAIQIGIRTSGTENIRLIGSYVSITDVVPYP